MQDLVDLNFHKVGEFKLEGRAIQPSGEEPVGIVYAWVLEGEDSLCEIIYIGKAGKTLSKRLREHCIGFHGPKRGSKSGALKASFIVSELGKQRRVSIWRRISTVESVLGVPEVSLCSVEEDALIKRFKPRLNGRIESIQANESEAAAVPCVHYIA